MLSSDAYTSHKVVSSYIKHFSSSRDTSNPQKPFSDYTVGFIFVSVLAIILALILSALVLPVVTGMLCSLKGKKQADQIRSGRKDAQIYVEAMGQEEGETSRLISEEPPDRPSKLEMETSFTSPNADKYFSEPNINASDECQLLLKPHKSNVSTVVNEQGINLECTAGEAVSHDETLSNEERTTKNVSTLIQTNSAQDIDKETVVLETYETKQSLCHVR